MFTKKIFAKFQNNLPSMSQTEREALEAGNVWWDGELFKGKPDWNILQDLPPATLTKEEAQFLSGPVQELCEMLDDYDINHHRAALPEKVWTFLKENKFFGIHIPKKYGGLSFSAHAHATIVTKIASRCIPAAVTVMVPNSLGPAELLMKYGTETEKDNYLPRLANGSEIPCFALTGPTAGSDASSIPDVGYVGTGTWEGEEVLGLYLHFNKRYITLAPVATLMGLAVKVEDPHKLLDTFDSNATNITVVLLPTELPGIEIGNRHDPLTTAFKNGPIRGKDVFVPLDHILGGVQNIGKGWKMLVECLSVGRAISLPSLAVAGGKLASSATGAYARIRRQFNRPIGKFEGVEEKLALIAGNTFIMDCTRDLTIRAIDRGEKPSVLSVICKYHLTEMNRELINAAMDIQGGSGICLGPRNLLGKTYQALPIAITVEGANILTRNMIIFGQGAMRCHPYIQSEIDAAHMNNDVWFNGVFWKHVRHLIANITRTKLHGFTNSLFSKNTLSTFAKQTNNTRTQVNRLSAAFAVVSDVTLLLLGSSLKRKERISARLGDILSYMYMLSAISTNSNKYFLAISPVSQDLYSWAERTLLHKAQEAFYELFDNYPNKYVGKLLRFMVFPYGRIYHKPTDKDDHLTAEVILYPSDTRNELVHGVFRSNNPEAKTALLETTHRNINRYELLEQVIHQDKSLSFEERISKSIEYKLIDEKQAEFLLTTHHAINELVQVDDFEVV